MPQEKNYFVVTGAGLNLLANLKAGTQLEITRVVVGDGEIPDDTDPRTLNNLITPIAQATSTVPLVTDNRLNFDVEYRNDFGKFDDPAYWIADGYFDVITGKLAVGFSLREYGVFALDAHGAEILLYYATIAAYPEAVYPYTPNNVQVKRYPVQIEIMNEGLGAALTFDAGAFVTHADLQQTVENAIDDLLLVSKRIACSSQTAGKYLVLTTNMQMPATGTHRMYVNLNGRIINSGLVCSQVYIEITDGAFITNMVYSYATAFNYGTKVFVNTAGFICIQLSKLDSAFTAANLEYSAMLIAEANGVVTDATISNASIETADTPAAVQLFVNSWHQHKALQSAVTETVPVGVGLKDYISSMGKILNGSINLTIQEDQNDDVYINNFSSIYANYTIIINGDYKKGRNIYIHNNQVYATLQGANATPIEGIYVMSAYLYADTQTVNILQSGFNGFVYFLNSSALNYIDDHRNGYIELVGSIGGTVNNVRIGSGTLLIDGNYAGNIQSTSYYSDSSYVLSNRGLLANLNVNQLITKPYAFTPSFANLPNGVTPAYAQRSGSYQVILGVVYFRASLKLNTAITSTNGVMIELPGIPQSSYAWGNNAGGVWNESNPLTGVVQNTDPPSVYYIKRVIEGSTSILTYTLLSTEEITVSGWFNINTPT